MLQKPKLIKSIVIACISVFIIFLTLVSGTMNFCGIRHVSILQDIKNFEINQDPEFCETTVEKILEFNEQCEPYIEILDCG